MKIDMLKTELGENGGFLIHSSLQIDLEDLKKRALEMVNPKYTEKLRIKVDVYIKCNETQEIVKYPDELYCQDGHPDVYMWEEGNYSCDCNRELFFETIKSGKSQMETYWNTGGECSEGRYSVKIAISEDGSVLYNEIIEDVK